MDQKIIDDDISKVSGGHDTTLHKQCPFCGVTFHIDGMARYREGDYITRCAKGHEVYKGNSGYDVKNGDEVRRIY